MSVHVVAGQEQKCGPFPRQSDSWPGQIPSTAPVCCSCVGIEHLFRRRDGLVENVRSGVRTRRRHWDPPGRWPKRQPSSSATSLALEPPRGIDEPRSVPELRRPAIIGRRSRPIAPSTGGCVGCRPSFGVDRPVGERIPGPAAVGRLLASSSRMARPLRRCFQPAIAICGRETAHRTGLMILLVVAVFAQVEA